MHEMFLAERVVAELDRVVRPHLPCRLTKVTLNVGALRQAEPELLRFALDVSAKSRLAGIADRAEWVIQTVPARCRCDRCGCGFELEQWTWQCPTCGSADLTPAGPGDELVIQTITVEKEDDAGRCHWPSANPPLQCTPAPDAPGGGGTQESLDASLRAGQVSGR